jgi:hypothetical protein
MAVDLDARLVWFRLNGGNWGDPASPGDPETGVRGNSIAGMGTNVFIAGGHQWYPPNNTLNTGHSPFVDPVPGTFGAWDV